MAITVTQRGTVCTNADSSTYDIASVAITNTLVYVAFIYSSIGAGTAPSVTGVAVQSGTGTLTMDKLTTTGEAETFSGGVRRVECWYGTCTASGTATMRATLDATSTNTSMQIYELGGVDTGTGGLDAFVQAISENNGSTSTTSLAVAMANAADSNNRYIAFCVHRANEATAHDSGDGYTELFDGNHNSPSGGVCVQWHSTSAANPTIDFSWTTSSANGGIGLELAIAPGGGGTGGPLTGGKLSEPSLLVKGRLAS